MTSSQPSPAEAARELLRRRRARRRLLDFTNYTFPQYRAEAFHTLLADTLDRVLAGEIKRLMVFAPPQHGKSELVSVRFPAYWLAQRPDDPVILTSYAASLAYSKSRQARGVIEGPEWRVLFPGVETNPESRAVDHWGLKDSRGELLAAGVGGPITGHGAKLGIIDDPVENWEQAQSETYREKTWEWYRTTFRTRIHEGGAIVLVMTRWHLGDLAGKLLAQDPGQWTVLRLPALSKGEGDPLGRAEGEPLCPLRFSRKALLAIKRDIGSRAWSAEYDGDPVAAEGNLFKRAWFPIVGTAPALARRVRYWDRAATPGGGDYTAGVLMAEADGIYYVEDVKRGQWSTGEREAITKQTAQLDASRHVTTVWLEQEPGSSGVDSAKATIKALAGFDVHAETVTGSKEVRAGPFAAQAEAGNVRLVSGRWNEAYLDELTAFPNGEYDDQVDGSSGAFNKLTGPRYERPGVVRYA